MLKDSLTLLQGYYSYLLMSLYTDNLLKEGKIPHITTPVIYHTTKDTDIQLNATRINQLITQIGEQPDEKNVYGYLGYMSGIKGMLGVCMDMTSTSLWWRKFLQKTMGSQYEAYTHSIRFCRNLLTHQQTPNFQVSRDDLLTQKEYLIRSGKRIVALSFRYSDLLGDKRTGSSSYGFHITINTTTLLTKRTLFTIIDQHTLFMLAESVYNLASLYQQTLKPWAK